MIIRMLKALIRPLSSYAKYKIKAMQWRKRNSHNETSISKNVKNIDIIEVGKATYGVINTASFENKNEKLQIGNYVSIASDVIFILGGNHQIQTFSTFPIKAKCLIPFCEQDAQTKGTIIVEDEVWIGANAIILSGVTIGKGAIIAAGSVVTKDVEPFAIVGGNPAQLIKYRFDEAIREQRMAMNLADIPMDKVLKSIDLFYTELNQETIHKIKNL